MEIDKPYLLFLGDATDPIEVKTARGILQWRPEFCIGQYRLNSDTVSLGLKDLSLNEAKKSGVKTLVLGLSNAGGFIPDHWMSVLIEAANLGLNIASGMHKRLKSIPELVKCEHEKGISLYDVRHHTDNLPVGNGKKRQGKRLLTVGTDCSVGKMYTALAIERKMQENGISAQFKATGQTGIFIAGSGISIDAVISDFISGSVETLSPSFNDHQWDIIEGQGSLFHPAYAGVSLGLLHGAQADALVLCHEVDRVHVRHTPHMTLPTIDEAIHRNLEAARLTNKEVKLVGISLNTSSIDETSARQLCATWQENYKIPVTDPVRFGIDGIVTKIKAM